MRFLLYFVLIYVFIPVNSTIDLISILTFFVVLNENEKFAIMFAFFFCLVLDLYYPISLGLNILAFLILSEVLIYLKRYFVREPLTLLFIFTVFHLLRVLVIYLANGTGINHINMLLTITISLPVLHILNRICFKVWMKA